MASVRRYFELDCLTGAVQTSGGELITPEPDAQATWFAIKDYGVFEKGKLPDISIESGTVWELQPPAAFLKLCEDIAAWEEKSGETLSERFGDYTVTRAASWREAFAPRLQCWQRMFTEVTL